MTPAGRGADLPDLPPAVLARFPGHDAATLRQPAHRDFVVGRLLEDGTGAELRWLVAAVGAAELGEFVRRRGGRALSRRSRAFWERVLAVEAAAGPPLASELWPLA